MELRIDPRGQVVCVYGEAIDLAVLGEPSIRRASHVEPDDQGRWWADLAPVGGPRLGPYARRSQALAAEVGWLEAHWLPAGGAPASGRGAKPPYGSLTERRRP
jgi:hypothetical protein